MFWRTKHLIKTSLQRLSPAAHARFMNYRNARAGRIMRGTGVEAITAKFLERQGAVVHGGPFHKMVYLSHAHCSMLMPKLAGSYEYELRPVIADVIRKPYDRIIDVGSAEGYYAVGLAIHCPAAEVFAYDIDPAARTSCEELANLNGVADRVTVLGACDTAELQNRLIGRCFIVCDCEGYETELLDPSKAAALKGADLIVELHEIAKPGVTRLLHQRFEATHSVHLIKGAKRKVNSQPSIAHLSHSNQVIAMNEFRHGPERWMLLKSKKYAGG